MKMHFLVFKLENFLKNGKTVFMSLTEIISVLNLITSS